MWVDSLNLSIFAAVGTNRLEMLFGVVPASLFCTIQTPFMVARSAMFKSVVCIANGAFFHLLPL